MIKISSYIAISLVLTYFINCYSYNAQSQKIMLNRSNVKFIIEVINSKIYEKNDTLKIRYRIINNSQSDIAIVDTEMMIKSAINPISFNKHLTVLQLDLGGLEIINEFDSIKKYRMLKKTEQYSSDFSFPISLIKNNVNQNIAKQIQYLTKDEYVEVPLEVYIGYSFDDEIINGQYSEILHFENYLGYLNNNSSFDLVQYMQMIKISGIYVQVKIDAN